MRRSECNSFDKRRLNIGKKETLSPSPCNNSFYEKFPHNSSQNYTLLQYELHPIPLWKALCQASNIWDPCLYKLHVCMKNNEVGRLDHSILPASQNCQDNWVRPVFSRRDSLTALTSNIDWLSCRYHVITGNKSTFLESKLFQKNSTVMTIRGVFDYRSSLSEVS